MDVWQYIYQEKIEMQTYALLLNAAFERDVAYGVDTEFMQNPTGFAKVRRK